MLKNKYKKHQNYSYSLLNYFLNSNKPICILVKNNKEALYLQNELGLLIDKEKIKLFPENEILPYDHFSIPKNISKKRFKIINNNSQDKHILITSIKNLFDRYPTIDNFKSKKSYEVGSQISLNELIKILESLNYIKKDNVENINEYTVRGGIIDIYTPIYKNPLRVEIFDDKIESIRFFNIDNQLSIKETKNFSLTKGDVISFDKSTINLFIDSWREYFSDFDERYCSLFQNIKNQIPVEGIEIYFPFFFKNTSSFFEIFSNYEYIKFEDLNSEILDYKTFINERFNDESYEINRPLIKPEDLYTDMNEIINNIKNIKPIKMESFDCPYNKIEDLISDYEEILLKKDNYIIMTSNADDFEDLINIRSPNLSITKELYNLDSQLNLMLGEIVRPMFLKNSNTYILHMENLDNVIRPRNDQVSQSRFIESNKTFNENEYVIHEDYGLGRYSGLEIVEADNKLNEYIKIIYAKNEVLYVPLNNINKLSSYHKKEISDPLELDSLSSKKWSSKKEKASKRAIDHAAEILDIESRRLNSLAPSLKVSEDTMKEFEDGFPYIETPDQISSFNDIKKDLSLIKPMNRVLCGDVGFGKTEVAMKSAFVAVNSSKQIIVITPSTILSDQHYNSFLQRFRNFGVSIGKLNRFVSKDKKTQLIDDFNSNKIDILVGTHIIFNDEINFKNTGLLIIDEEHKFGIKQKNYIKNKQENCHVLYLSATPIPRTMNMVFSGLKDFSFLHTAPSNRINIKSFLKIHTNQIFKEALIREKSRGGQSFIIQNDIEKIERTREQINELLPDFEIGIAHGRLSKKNIKKVMNEFKNGSLDALICTTIVEMGLDIPNANTMLIINSQNFGLSQLHQLRGRIGRSDRQAYCYFLIPDIEIPKISRTRLDSIMENSNLGEGFMIAQEDLEIRGGGEMLGERQSGHVNNVGMSLYLSMLNKAINTSTLKSIELENKPEVNFNDSAYIDSSYLPSPIERLKIYRKIEESITIDELNDISKNLIDRCGAMPIEVNNLINNKKIGIRISQTGIKSIKSNFKNTNFNLSKELNNDILNKFLKLISKDSDIYSINKEDKFIYKNNEIDSEIRRKNVNLLLDEIL
tara:strand:- start:1990 stop:5274 length:3285 start_codon:yes stop_codon:yes gene_type:complete